MLPVVVGLSLVVGLLLGLMGGGGSILTVPLLTAVAGMDAKEAVPSSLVMVGVSSLVAALVHARRGSVAWRTGLTFGAASMAGAFAGGFLGGLLPGVVLMIGFAMVMLVSAVRMIRPRKGGAADSGDGGASVPLARVVLQGVVVGLITGVVGAGGGFLIVPALVLLAGLSMPVAVGTSLLVIALNSAMGLVGHLGAVSLDWAVLGPATAASAAAAVVGVLLAHRVPAKTLKTAFGWFVLVMGVLILVQQVIVLAG